MIERLRRYIARRRIEGMRSRAMEALDAGDGEQARSLLGQAEELEREWERLVKGGQVRRQG